MIYFAADHRGFQLKEELKKFLVDAGFSVEDSGALAYNRDDDYVDFARAALENIVKDPVHHKGIFICGSGHGMNMVADKYNSIRAALAFHRNAAIQSREHEDANVLVLASDWLTPEETKEITLVWLKTPFSGEERHIRRLKKIQEIEEKNFR